ncbi:hypothetical protein [Nocardiopsis halotolerans]|uniref:hypothetical protein n=1 Tax=Nocardiopsis halotolerans TaxID=124252 RepID=UPI0003473DEE|nr:hypothetical protein [Nocardiopsis halotolerans]
MGVLGAVDEPGVLATRIAVTLLLTCLPAWHLARILAIPANVRGYLRGFNGFTGWMTGLVLMPVSLLVLGLLPVPWGLWGLALLLTGYLWQRYGRRLAQADIVSRERANDRSSAR